MMECKNTYADDFPALQPLASNKTKTTTMTVPTSDFSESDSERIDSSSMTSEIFGSARSWVPILRRLDGPQVRETTTLTTRTVCHKFCDRKRRNQGPNKPLPAGTRVVVCGRKDYGEVHQEVNRSHTRVSYKTVRDRDLAHGECWYKICKPMKGWIRASALMDAPSLVYRMDVLKLDTKLTTKTSAYCWRHCNGGSNNSSFLLKAGTSVYVKKFREFPEDRETWFFVTDYVSRSERRDLIDADAPFIEGWVDQEALFSSERRRVTVSKPVAHVKPIANALHSKAESRKRVAEASRFPYFVNETVMCNVDGKMTKAVVTGITPLKVLVQGETISREVQLSSISKASTTTFVVTEKSGVGIRIHPKNSNSVMRLKQWTEIEIVDFEGHFAKIHKPMVGWVRFRNDYSASMVPRAYQPKLEDLSLLVKNIPLDCTSEDLRLCIGQGYERDVEHVRTPLDMNRTAIQIRPNQLGDAQIALVKFPARSSSVSKILGLERHCAMTPYVLGGERLVMQMRPRALFFAATMQKDVNSRWNRV